MDAKLSNQALTMWLESDTVPEKRVLLTTMHILHILFGITVKDTISLDEGDTDFHFSAKVTGTTEEILI